VTTCQGDPQGHDHTKGFMPTRTRQISSFEVLPNFKTLYLLLVFAAVLGLFAAGLAAPRLTREDGVFESAAALSFALGALVAAAFIFKRWHGLDSTERGLFGAAGVFSALAFLSEVSFGARHFGWSMPKMAGGGELDGVHDVVIMSVRWARGATAAALGLMVGLVTAVLGVTLWLLRSLIFRLARRTSADPVLFGMAVSAVLLCAAVGLDTSSIRRAEFLEEALETVASFSLLAAFVLGFSRHD
jgi:hypothetical protein